jgi:uncharacterized membrane protein YhaH (DUF805 family)
MEFIRQFLASVQNTNGRLSRSLFFRYSSFLTFLVIAAAALVTLSGKLLFGTGLLTTYLFVSSLFFLLSLPWAVILVAKRFHDFGLSGWMFLAIVIADFSLRFLTTDFRQPSLDSEIILALVDLAIVIGISLWPGASGTNRFGPPAQGT